MIKTNKTNALVGFISCSLLLFMAGPLSPFSREKRRLDIEYQVEKNYRYYKMILGEDVSEGMREMQKIVRVREKCELPGPPEDNSESESEHETQAEPKPKYPESKVEFKLPDEDHPYGLVIDTEFSHDHEDSHITWISCQPVHYRFQASAVQGIEDSIVMVFGVLSGKQRKVQGVDLTSSKRRNAIRNTWGQGNKVFFIVAGDWDYIKDEYQKYNDIIWVDQPERDSATILDSFKTEIFLTVMNDHVIKDNVNSVEYFFKTNDDSYVNVEHLQAQIDIKNQDEAFEAVDYWGKCIEKQNPSRDETKPEYTPYEFYPYNYFPTYCIGSGYVLSKKFVNCAVEKAHIERSINLRNEAQTIGLLAEKCGIQPSLDWLEMEARIFQRKVLSNVTSSRQKK